MNQERPIFTPGLVAQLIIVVVLIPLSPLLISQQWRWWEAWAYAAVNIASFVLSRWLLARRHPDLLAERARGLGHDDAKSWDKTLAPLVGVGGGLVPIVAGLDARLAGSLELGAAAHGLALLLLLAGHAFGTYALLENPFFSGMVRIQTERGHYTVSGGPYRWVRHPGYLGAIVAYLATPFLLDSLWALAAAAAIVAVLVLRTRLEDDTLRAELDGYEAYAERTRYRLLPGVW